MAIVLLVLTIVQGVAGLYIMYCAVLALNRMSGRTRLAVKVAHIMLVMGAAGAIAACFVHRDFFNAVFAAGVALYLGCNRRGAQYDHG